MSTMLTSSSVLGQNPVPRAAVEAALRGGKPAYPHYKYNFIAGSQHYSVGKSSGAYGWTKEKQLEQEAMADEMLHRMTSDASEDLIASGLGYGKYHHFHQKYITMDDKERRVKHEKNPVIVPNGTARPLSLPPIANPATNPSARVTGWYESEDNVVEVEEKELRLAAGLGYGARHTYVS